MRPETAKVEQVEALAERRATQFRDTLTKFASSTPGAAAAEEMKAEGVFTPRQGDMYDKRVKELTEEIKGLREMLNR